MSGNSLLAAKVQCVRFSCVDAFTVIPPSATSNVDKALSSSAHLRKLCGLLWPSTQHQGGGALYGAETWYCSFCPPTSNSATLCQLTIAAYLTSPSTGPLNSLLCICRLCPGFSSVIPNHHVALFPDWLLLPHPMAILRIPH